jgi:hypothetical protein
VNRMLDAEALLRGARRPLVLGMGGGGDVVGALATAEFSRLYDGADPVVGGVTWERRAIDPVPGPRRRDEIEGGEELAPGVLLADADTRVRGRDVVFAESKMAGFLGQGTVLVDVNPGPGEVASSLERTVERLGCDLVVFIDVGGDVVAQGHEKGLSSPLCDAVMLAAASKLGRAGHQVLAGIFGIGCDAELTTEEVLAQVAEVAAEGGLLGVRGLTEPVVERLEEAMELVPTEASAQAVRAFRGVRGPVTIRGGARTFELSAVAALTYYLDVEVTYRTAGRLARAVSDADTLVAANELLGRMGVRTELDLEQDAAAGDLGADGFDAGPVRS